MKKTTFMIRALALVAYLLCTMSAVAAEAYACYSPSNATLSFYYDNQRSSRSGTTYDLNSGTNLPLWYSNRDAVTTVYFSNSFANYHPTTTYKWFYSFTNLTEIEGIRNLKTDQVTNMSHMFDGCNKLSTINVKKFDTSNVTDFS